MNISQRLVHVAKMMPMCINMADIGTDHGYLPIYAVTNKISTRAIAADINSGPIEAARKNIKRYGLEGLIDTRRGPGLSVLHPGEADTIVIAGMGGPLISQIIEDDILTARRTDFLILQPVQYPEALRKYLICNGFSIMDEDMVFEDHKYYHIIKATNQKSNVYEKEIYYYLGLKLIEKRHPLLGEYIKLKLNSFNSILSQLSASQEDRRNELLNLKFELEEVLKCL